MRKWSNNPAKCFIRKKQTELPTPTQSAAPRLKRTLGALISQIGPPILHSLSSDPHRLRLRPPSIELRPPSIELRPPSIEFGTPSIEFRTPSIEFRTPPMEFSIPTTQSHKAHSIS